MTTDDWHNPRLRALGMLLDGRMLRDTDARGARLSDETYLVLFNAGRAGQFVLPEPPDAWGWEPIVSTEPERGRRRATALPPGTTLVLRPRLVQVLRAIGPG